MRIRCPHCHESVETVENDPTTEIHCEACGSNFSLLTGATATAPARQTRYVAHFQLLQELGTGAHGSVWKARDTELDRMVAIKLPRREQLDHAQSERFLREARAAAQLSHPGIVSVHEVGRDGEQLYIVSDYIDGATLDEWMQAKRLTFRRAAEIVASTCDALQHAHDQRIIHRDLKPSNIMLDRQGSPHVTDFGLAKRDTVEATMTVDGQILGTPSYMSPEQARGEGHHADARSDVYSLGVTLFKMLTCELPFRGSSRMVLLQIQNDEPPNPCQLNSAIPRDLATITLKCLEKEPSRRYQSTAALAADLRRWLAGEPITARPTGTFERFWRWCRRNPKIASLSAALAAMLLVIAIGSMLSAIWIGQQRDEAQRQRDEAQRQSAEAQRQRDEARRQQSIAENALGKGEDAIRLLTEVAERRLKDVPHMEQWQRELLVKARDFYRELHALHDDRDSPRLRFESALAEKRIGDISALLDENEQARQAFQAALELVTQLAKEDPEQRGYAEQLGVVKDNLAEVLRELGQTSDAEPLYRQAIELQTALQQSQPEDRNTRRELSRTHNNLGILLHDAGQLEVGREHYRAAIELLEQLVAEDASEPDYRSDLARAYNNLGNNLEGTDRGEAMAAFDQSASQLRILIDEATTSTDHRYTLRDYRYKLGTTLTNRANVRLKDLPSVETDAARHASLLEASGMDLSEAESVLASLCREYPSVPVYTKEHANCLNSLGTLSYLRNKPEQMTDYWQQARRLLEQLIEQPNDQQERAEVHEYHAKLGMVLGNLGWAYKDVLSKQSESSGNRGAALEQARELTEQSLERYRAALELDSGNAEYQAHQSHYSKQLDEVNRQLAE